MQEPAERRYLADVLKINYEGRDQDSLQRDSIRGLGMEFTFHRHLNERHYAAHHPEILEPVYPAFSAMKYADDYSACVAYGGNDYKAITIGFPLECIKDEIMKIQSNSSGTRSIEVSEEHLMTIEHYQLFRDLIDSNGYVDEQVLDKLKLNIRSLLEGDAGKDKRLLDLCLDVIYHQNMKAFGPEHEGIRTAAAGIIVYQLEGSSQRRSGHDHQSRAGHAVQLIPQNLKFRIERI